MHCLGQVAIQAVQPVHSFLSLISIMVNVLSSHDRDYRQMWSRLLVLLVLIEQLEQFLRGIVDTQFEEANPYQSFHSYPYRDREIFVYRSFKSNAVKVTEEVGS